MCGRFAVTLPPDAMRTLFAYSDQPNFPARYNIAPTQPIPIIRAESRDGRIARRFHLIRWGFLPGFAKDPKSFPLLFNVRAEGLASKASFRNSLRRRRCLVPADAFYEWHRLGTSKTDRSQPYMCRRADGLTMGLAGLWETWMGPNGEEVDTACIVTTGANGVSAAIHPRLPAIIDPEQFSIWLDPDETKSDAAMALLRPPENNLLTFEPISHAVNKIDHDDASIQVPISAPLAMGLSATRAQKVSQADQLSLF